MVRALIQPALITEANGKKIISWLTLRADVLKELIVILTVTAQSQPKDILYAGMYFGKKTPVLDNQGPDKVKIKAY